VLATAWVSGLADSCAAADVFLILSNKNSDGTLFNYYDRNSIARNRLNLPRRAIISDEEEQNSAIQKECEMMSVTGSIVLLLHQTTFDSNISTNTLFSFVDGIQILKFEFEFQPGIKIMHQNFVTVSY
jgi:hypothetical protein